MRFAASLLGALRLRADSDPTPRPPHPSPPLPSGRPRSSAPPPPPRPRPPAKGAPPRGGRTLGARPANPAETAAASAAGLRGADAREAGRIGWFRGRLFDAHAGLARAWGEFDGAPEQHYDTRGVRAARRAVESALHDYYAAAGGPSPHAISHVLAAAEESDRRIAALDGELVAEVRRLELLARDVSAALAGAADPSARATAAADADDALIELELYRESCAQALDPHTAERLDSAQSILKSIVDTSGTARRSENERAARSARAQRFASLPPDVSKMLPPAPPLAPPSKYMDIPGHQGAGGERPQVPRKKQMSHQRPAVRSPSQPEPRSLAMHLDGETASSSGSSSSRRARAGVLRNRRSNENGATAPKRRRPSAFFFGFGKTSKDEPAVPLAQRQPPVQRQPSAQRPPLGSSAATVKRKQSNVTNTVSNSMRSFWGLVRPPPGGPGGPPASTGPPREPEPAPAAQENSNGQTSDGLASGESASSSSSATESGEELPLRMVMSRNRTLRDVAEFARHMAEGEETPEPKPEPSPEKREFPRTPAASFSTALYQTNNARKDAISDAGVMLTSSKVLGDGRCLFRSIARGRAVTRGEVIPKPHAEKKAADRLRARAVEELRRNKALLLRFYVIEDNFDNYLERMSQPKTYGGEPELLMLAKILRTPIAVYLMLNGMYRRIQLYGKQYQGEPIRIRYCNDTHYDSLIPTTYRAK